MRKAIHKIYESLFFISVGSAKSVLISIKSVNLLKIGNIPLSYN